MTNHQDDEAVEHNTGPLGSLPAGKARSQNRIASIAPDPGRDVAAWIDRTGRLRRAPASTALSDPEIFEALPARIPSKYQHRRHYQGRYWFAQLSQHIWHESMLEYEALMWLDHTEPVSRIAAQPMKLFFAEGRTHVPDYIVQSRDGQCSIVNIRPEDRQDDAFKEQQEAVGRVAVDAGWLSTTWGGVPTVAGKNLEFLGCFRRPQYAPSPEIADVLTRAAADGATLASLRTKADTPAILHLLWIRRLTIDLGSPLTARSIITTPTP
ncbi:MAG: TnsA-like heteromeric transposase endonuclease subunit [Thermomicrobiales bacterium]